MHVELPATAATWEFNQQMTCSFSAMSSSANTTPFLIMQIRGSDSRRLLDEVNNSIRNRSELLDEAKYPSALYDDYAIGEIRRGRYLIHLCIL
jgi:hypothetical protein